MIKVLYQKRMKSEKPHEQPQCIYSLEDIDGGIRVIMDFPARYKVNRVFNEDALDYEDKIMQIEPGERKHLDIIFNDYLGRVMNVRVSNDFGGHTLIMRDRFDTARFIDFTSTGGRDEYYYPILNFAISEDASEVVLFFRAPTYELEGYECELIDVGLEKKGYIQRMMDNSEFCRRKILAYKTKHEEIVKEVDIYDTVTYLESQVDALTRLVLALASNMNNTDEYALLKEADNYSVLDMKTLDNLIKEIKEDKGNVRKLQSKFYPEIEAITN